MQAYDSVAIDADVEIGGTDQLYTLLTGRDVMERYGEEPTRLTYRCSSASTAPKMSKSRGNYIGILEPPEEMFGKTMSIPDGALSQWELLVGGGEHPEAHRGSSSSRAAHRALARRGGREAGEDHFHPGRARHETPAEVPEAAFAANDGVVYLPAVLQSELGRSASHWRRQIDQGGSS